MSLLGRLRRLAGTSVGALLAPAEDPRGPFADAHRRQRLLLQRVQASLAAVRGSRGRLEDRVLLLQAELPLLGEQARAAVVSGQEELARLKLRRRELTLAVLRDLDDQRGQMEREEANLSLTEQRLTAEIEALHTRQELIAARYSAAEAQVRIHESVSGVSLDLRDLALSLERAAEGAERMRARAAAIEELVARDELPSAATAADPDLDEAVETQLARLRESL